MLSIINLSFNKCQVLLERILTQTIYRMKCVECNGDPRYKCPTCRQPYCSVSCYKKHKEIPCSPPPEERVEDQAHPKSQANVNYQFPTEDTVPPEKLNLLETSKELKKCLENPHVRTLLETLDKSPNPDGLIQQYMQEPIFTELVDACLKVVQDNVGDGDEG